MDSKQLDSLIHAAIKKVSAKKENELCRYLPSPTGGYVHHFTMRKMKGESPQKLADLITKNIINASNPQRVTPKQRAPRGTRKRRDIFTFSRQELEKVLNMARLAGDRDMIRKLTPPKDLKTIKRELLSSIRHGKVEPELWNLYMEAMTSQSFAAHQA